MSERARSTGNFLIGNNYMGKAQTRLVVQYQLQAQPDCATNQNLNSYVITVGFGTILSMYRPATVDAYYTPCGMITLTKK